jgi:hypothetical protein
MQKIPGLMPTIDKLILVFRLQRCKYIYQRVTFWCSSVWTQHKRLRRCKQTYKKKTNKQTSRHKEKTSKKTNNQTNKEKKKQTKKKTSKQARKQTNK